MTDIETITLLYATDGRSRMIADFLEDSLIVSNTCLLNEIGRKKIEKKIKAFFNGSLDEKQINKNGILDIILIKIYRNRFNKKFLSTLSQRIEEIVDSKSS